MKSNIRLYSKIKPNTEIPLDLKVWSGGEVSVRIANPAEVAISKSLTIVADLFDSDGVMCLVMLVDAIRNINSKAKITLTMPYVPYARQDRVCNAGEAFGIKVFANIINSLGLNRVHVIDPHSSVTPDLINNCVATPLSELLDDFGSEYWDFVVVAPDAGAVKRAEGVAKHLNCPIVYAEKTRDQLTGRITGGRLDLAGVDCSGKDLLVVDDICDGGRTFVALAKMIDDELKRSNASLNLLVSHGIFSQGADVLTDVYDNVFVINGFPGISIKEL